MSKFCVEEGVGFDKNEGFLMILGIKMRESSVLRKK